MAKEKGGGIPFDVVHKELRDIDPAANRKARSTLAGLMIRTEGYSLRAFRVLSGLTREEFAKVLKISVSRLQEIERKVFEV